MLEVHDVYYLSLKKRACYSSYILNTSSPKAIVYIYRLSFIFFHEINSVLRINKTLRPDAENHTKGSFAQFMSYISYVITTGLHMDEVPTTNSKSTVVPFLLCEHGIYQAIFNELLIFYDFRKIALSHCFIKQKVFLLKRKELGMLNLKIEKNEKISILIDFFKLSLSFIVITANRNNSIYVSVLRILDKKPQRNIC